MKSYLLFGLLSVFAYSNQVVADGCDSSERTVTGAPAKALISALKVTGLTPRNTSSSIDYTIDFLQCQMTNGGVFDDGLNQFDCQQAPPKAISDSANAEIVFEALSGFGLFVDSGMNHNWLSANKVSCQIFTGDSISYRCTLTAIWADTCNP